jgi:uncharacterized protein (TIGR02145 family)
MAENLATDTDTDSNPVTCDANTEADPDFVEHYGCLYSWEDAMKVCPDGWHLPSKEDFDSLLNAVGTSNLERSQNLRASSWSNGADILAFGALPAGCFLSSSTNGAYNGFGDNAFFWHSTPKDDVASNEAYDLFISKNEARVNTYSTSHGFSVRCLKD